MKDRAAAIRLARALEAALDGDAEVETTADELRLAASIWAHDPATAEAFSNPAFDVARRRTLLETLSRGAKLSPKTERFLKILLEKERLPLLPEIAEAMESIRDRRLGIVEAEVTTAVHINGVLAERTKQLLEEATGRKVRLALKTDPSIVGGLVARIGSTVYDGSIKTRLAALRSQIARG